MITSPFNAHAEIPQGQSSFQEKIKKEVYYQPAHQGYMKPVRKYGATLAVVFDTKKTNNPDLGIIKIRVTYRRKKRPYTTGIKVSKDLWLRLKKTGPVLDNLIKDETLINLHRSIYGYQKDGQNVDGWMNMYRNCVERMGPNFSFEELKIQIGNYGRYDPTVRNEPNVLKALKNKKAYMHSKGRVGNGDIYGSLSHSLLRFVQTLTTRERLLIGLQMDKNCKDVPLTFNEITVDFLEKYEQWMLHYGKAPQQLGGMPGPATSTTVGIYARHLRVLYNDAIRNKIVEQDINPFGRGKYIIPGGRKPKKALPNEALNLIKSYQPIGYSELRAHDLWLFTYYSNGLNMSDICHLRWKDINEAEGCFTFIRRKTLRTSKSDAKTITAHLRPETNAIIQRWATPKKRDGYVFPFLEESMDEVRKKQVIGQTIKQTNKWMKRIGEKLGISHKLVTYSARHSFGTNMLRAGAPIKLIGDSFGHSSITTTERYLADFETEKVKEFLKAL